MLPNEMHAEEPKEIGSLRSHRPLRSETRGTVRPRLWEPGPHGDGAGCGVPTLLVHSGSLAAQVEGDQVAVVQVAQA